MCETDCCSCIGVQKDISVTTTGVTPGGFGGNNLAVAYDSMLEFLPEKNRLAIQHDRQKFIAANKSPMFEDLVGSRYLYYNPNFLTCSLKSGTCSTREDIFNFGAGVPSTLTRPNMYNEDVQPDILLTLKNLGNNDVDYSAEKGQFVARCKSDLSCQESQRFATNLNSLKNLLPQHLENVRTVLLSYQCNNDESCNDRYRKELIKVIHGETPNQMNYEDG